MDLPEACWDFCLEHAGISAWSKLGFLCHRNQEKHLKTKVLRFVGKKEKMSSNDMRQRRGGSGVQEITRNSESP